MTSKVKTTVLLFLIIAMAGFAVAATCEGSRPGCTSCDDRKPTSCNMCAAGYHLTFTGSDGACSPCAAGKGKAADTQAQTGDTTCDIDCAGGCLTCSGTSNECLRCKAGYSLNFGAKTCSMCSTGKGRAADDSFPTENTTCEVECSSGSCLVCGSAPNECLACKAGFQYTSATKICTSCSSGKGIAADTAPRSEDSVCSVDCDTKCAFCGASSTQCVGCSEGYQLNIGSNSCSICSGGSGRAGDTEAQTQDTTCGITCSSSGCNTCGSTASKCLGCKAAFSYIKSSSTCTPCSLGSGRGADLTLPTADTSCTVTCSADCLFCGDTADKCFGCKASYRLSLSDTKCKLCENGKGKVADTSPQTQDTTCDLSCNPECGACTADLSSCLSCRAGYKAIFVDGKTICVICAGGTGKAADSTPPTQEGVCNIECDIGCESCTEDRKHCISCSAGFYKKSQGVCDYCPAGTGKPVDTEPTIPSVTGGVAECPAVCHPTCRFCRGNSSTDCLNCAASYYSDGAGTCNACPDTSPRYQDSVIVKYTYAASNCNLDCDNSCASCRAPGSGNCKKCAAGFYWSTPVGNCVACPLGTGRPADSQDRSLTMTSTSSECNANCSDGCKHCSGSAKDKCLSCYRGYFKTSSGECQICPDGTGKGNDSEVNRQYTGSGINCLVKCNPACNVCYSGGSTNCLNCGAGYYLSAPGVCSLCPDGTSKVKDLGVVSPSSSSACNLQCHYSCRWCTSGAATACIACNGGFFWAGGGTCKTCDNTKGTPAQSGPAPLKGSTSKKSCTITCHPNCLTCSGEGPTDCVRCVAGFYLSAPGVCSICPKGKGKIADAVPKAISTTNGQAECTITCNATCRTCSGTGATQCVNCAVGYFFAGKGTCTVCETGKGKPADTVAMAKGTTSADACTATCDQACSRCYGNSPSECVRCTAGHFLSAPDTCTMCPAQKGKLADTSDPSPNANGNSACGVTCDSTCRTCSATGATSCLNCAAGYFFAGKGKCTICETGKGKPADTVVYKDGLTSAAVCTTTCSEACTNCYGEAPNACRICNAGFYKSAPDTCTMCPQGRGKVADTSVVNSGAANTLCNLSCDAASNCRTCDNAAAGNCLNCRGGFFWTGDGQCSVCDNGKSKNADETLMSAPTTQDAVCTIPCDKSCQICQGASDNCILCADGFYWKGNGKCEACNPGRGKPADIATPANAQTEAAACKNCHATCLGCSNQGEADCIKCRAAMFLTSAGKCELCPGGKGKPTDQDPVPRSIDIGISECSVTCNDACRNCDGTEANNCVTCKAGIFFQGSGVCTACDVGKGKPDDTTLPEATTSNAACKNCDSSCYTCKGEAKSDCLLCQAGHYLSAAGTCTMCPLGTGKPKDETIQEASDATAQCTTTCHPSCRTCKGPTANDCLNCHAGFWWAGNGVCTQCDPGQGIPESTQLENTPGAKENCETKCDEACLICSAEGANKCVKCAAGFFLSAENTCTMCPAGKGKSPDTNMPQVSNDDGETECGVSCPSGCRTCDPTGSLTCLNCMEAHYFSGPGTCTKCTTGTGKPRDTVLVKDPQQPEICKTCHASCVYCKGQAASDCLNCNEGFSMKTANTCSMCPIGHGKVADVDFPVEPIADTDGTGECKLKCHESCRTCKGTLSTECLNCNAAYFHSAAGECSACQVKTGKTADDRIIPPEELQTQAACTAKCHSSCNWCTGDTESKCLSCVAGFFKSDEGICSICPEKTGKFVDPSVFSPKTTSDAACTIQCTYPCLNCVGPATTDCLTCTDGHFMPTTGTCSLCPFGKGKLKDSQLAVPSSTDGENECKVTCNPRCSSCSTTEENTCVGCSGGFFWDSGVCKNCPVGTSKPAADTTGFTVPQTADTCSLTCHKSCQMCSGPGESDCLNCNSGFWWAGEGKCTKCSDGRGKLKDVQLFPDAPSFPDSCQIYCDVCDSGCLTCGEDPFSCTSCVVGRYLAANKTCTLCTDYCVECSTGDSCDRCAVNFKLSNDSKTCLGDCLVENCAVCAVDRSKCTKCNDEYVLKSETECVMDYGNAVEDLSQISIEESPRVDMNILQNVLLLNLPSTESQTITSVKVEDKLAEKTYTCEELSCSYTKTTEGIKFEFNPDFSITDGKLIIERGGVATKSIRSALTPSNRRMLQSLRSYPIVIDNISLMGQSRLKSFGFAMRVIVGILRLPLSLALFWKYPHFAMLMDHMVTHLRVYSLFGKPYMAYVEVVFQSVSESRVLPFNFANPFEHWNPSTLQCTGFSGIRSKNLHCSWFDNYGENLIGLLSVALLALILVKTGRYLSTRPDLLPWQKQVLAVVERDYGLKFVISKIDANHLEIITMTLVAYCTADSSSKSVIGIILSTIGLVAMAYLGGVLTHESLRMYQAKPDSRPASAAGQPANNKLQLIVDTHSSRSARPPSVASLHPHTPAKQDQLIPDDLPVAEAAQFVFDRSTFPATAWSHYFLAARYVRALLLAVFATTVRSSVEQVVLSVLLESAYLAVLILFDFRGTRLERLFYTGVHSLMLLHLILRAVATSSGLSDRDVQLVVATMIVVVLVAYIFVHVLAALWLAGTLFGQTSSAHSAKAPQPHHVTKMQVLESEADLAAEQDALPLPQGRPFFEELPAAVPAHATHPAFPSYIDQDIPQEFSPDQQDIPEEKSQRAHVGQIEVAVRADRPTQPRSFGQTDQF